MSQIVMTDTEFMDQAEALLQAVEASCDRINDDTDCDIDNQRVGGMVTLAFANGSQIVVNLQKPLQEVWLAAQSGGYHFRCNEAGRWIDTRGQVDFFEQLSADASMQADTSVTFAAAA